MRHVCRKCHVKHACAVGVCIYTVYECVLNVCDFCECIPPPFQGGGCECVAIGMQPGLGKNNKEE